MNILRRLGHPNIADFLGIAFKQELRPCIIIKYYKNGTTPKYLETHPDVDRLALIKDIANGLSYLHTLQPPIVHGDLKGVSESNSDNENRRTLTTCIVSVTLWSQMVATPS